MLYATSWRSFPAGQFDNRFFGVALEKAGNLANGVNFVSAELITDLPDQGGTGFAICSQLDFYQLVMIQRHFDFRQYVFAQTFFAYHDNGLQMVCQSTQVSNLLGC
jgi:hypothetical protein